MGAASRGLETCRWDLCQSGSCCSSQGPARGRGRCLLTRVWSPPAPTLPTCTDTSHNGHLLSFRSLPNVTFSKKPFHIVLSQLDTPATCFATSANLRTDLVVCIYLFALEPPQGPCLASLILCAALGTRQVLSKHLSHITSLCSEPGTVRRPSH